MKSKQIVKILWTFIFLFVCLAYLKNKDNISSHVLAAEDYTCYASSYFQFRYCPETFERGPNETCMGAAQRLGCYQAGSGDDPASCQYYYRYSCPDNHDLWSGNGCELNKEGPFSSNPGFNENFCGIEQIDCLQYNGESRHVASKDVMGSCSDSGGGTGGSGGGGYSSPTPTPTPVPAPIEICEGVSLEVETGSGQTVTGGQNLQITKGDELRIKVNSGNNYYVMNVMNSQGLSGRVCSHPMNFAGVVNSECPVYPNYSSVDTSSSWWGDSITIRLEGYTSGGEVIHNCKADVRVTFLAATPTATPIPTPTPTVTISPTPETTPIVATPNPTPAPTESPVDITPSITPTPSEVPGDIMPPNTPLPTPTPSGAEVESSNEHVATVVVTPTTTASINSTLGAIMGMSNGGRVLGVSTTLSPTGINVDIVISIVLLSLVFPITHFGRKYI
jgi:hypothetical protein